MAETTKLFSALPAVTSLNDTDKIASYDTNGGLQGITPANLYKTMYGAKDPAMMYDNILIAYCDSDAWMRMVHLDDWPSLQSSGKYAIGVVVSEGGKILVVAPTGGGQLNWASESVMGGGTQTTDRTTAIMDWNGKANTAAQAQKAACLGTDYAPGFCYNYSRLNSTNHGIKAGMWWLPSSGELHMIWNNIHKINYALSLITDAEQIPYERHWSSTEYLADNAWFQTFYPTSGYLFRNSKSSIKYLVRPVSAYNAV